MATRIPFKEFLATTGNTTPRSLTMALYKKLYVLCDSSSPPSKYTGNIFKAAFSPGGDVNGLYKNVITRVDKHITQDDVDVVVLPPIDVTTDEKQFIIDTGDNLKIVGVQTGCVIPVATVSSSANFTLLLQSLMKLYHTQSPDVLTADMLKELLEA